MKISKLFLTFFALIIVLLTSTTNHVNAETRTAIYFKETTCLVCAELSGTLNGEYNENNDYIKKMTDQGIDVITYDIMIDDPIDAYSYVENGETVNVTANDVFAAFNNRYDRDRGTVPVIFVGDQYFDGLEHIKDSIDDNTIYDLSANSLLDVDVKAGEAYGEITGFVGFLTILFAGLLDGFNPCAIALLLLFVSLLGFSENKKVLILVSIVYIFALFVSYFLIGTFLLNVLDQFREEANVIAMIINWFVAILCLFLFILNFYDFIKARNSEYGSIKNQLPKWIQRYNKKIVKSFTNVMNSEDNKGLIPILALTFVLGITLSVTELLCTGQIYFSILYGIHTLNSVYGYIALLAYNLMFVLPLIVIAVIAIKGQGVMATSNFIRERMDLIKLLNAILFLGIAIYYFSRIF
jgi:cytochrome c biogenesis protein CcdA/glutaredoxin